MKVISSCTISMNILQVIEEESYEYSGLVAECKGGGGGGSGVVDFPAYMKNIHNDWLDNTGVDSITSSVTDIMNSATGSSPWTAASAYDPDTDLVTMLAAPDVLQTLVTLLSAGTSLDTLVSGIVDHSRVDLAVTEYEADLDARLTAEILPRFEAGMRDINAVMSSSFALGKAVIEDGQTRQAALYSANQHSKAFSDDALQVINMKLEYQKAVSTMIAEANRIKIVAKKEENATDLKINEEDALWDLEVFQYGANLLGSIGGGTAISKSPKGASDMQSAIGGAMTGAAAGAMVGGPWGAVAGGVLGAGASFL